MFVGVEQEVRSIVLVFAKVEVWWRICAGVLEVWRGKVE